MGLPPEGLTRIHKFGWKHQKKIYKYIQIDSEVNAAHGTYARPSAN